MSITSLNKAKKNTRAILLGAGKPFKGESHSALKKSSGSVSNFIILDWILSSIKSVTENISFVGGYQLDQIKDKYTHLDFVENKNWEQTKSVYSLLTNDLDSKYEYIVSYVDIVYRNNTVLELMKSDSDIVIATDSEWLNRYAKRDKKDISTTEKVCVVKNNVTMLGKNLSARDASAEFVGLARFSKKAISFLKDERSELLNSFKKANLSELIEFLRLKGFSVSSVDTKGDWAELNNPKDIGQFILGTKAETLDRLQSLVTKSVILDQKTFTTKDWESNRSNILEEIEKRFPNKKVIIRSSALAEDTFETANAGAFESVLNVDPRNIKQIKKSINLVIDSYPDKNLKNQVLVQPMIDDIEGSGVIFTRTLERGSPYYVINYDDVSSSTESITSGNSLNFKTYKVRRLNVMPVSLPLSIIKLIDAVSEIENLFGNNKLDIEFAITKDKKINILQVRPIAVRHDFNKILDETIDYSIDLAKRNFISLQNTTSNIVGDKAYFGSMPDWNPAEIIGVRPGRLASDLYNHQIMSETWATQRAEYGYRDVRPFGLMKFFSGQPYVDIRASFNSFVPKNLDNEIAKKFVNFYMDYLKNHPEFHDKVEFEVVPTCFTFLFEEWRNKFKKDGNFSEDEISKLEHELKQITKKAINGNHSADLDLSKLSSKYIKTKESKIDNIQKALDLLDDSKRYGTLAFSHLARDGFVAATILKSAVKKGIISLEAMNDFMSSIRSVTHDLTNDAGEVNSGKLEWNTFVAKYGHLRPDTYNILSTRYSSEPEFFLRPIVEKFKKIEDTENYKIWNHEKINLFDALIKEGLCDSHEIIQNFLVSSIEGREYAKFLFTRNLSDAIELLAIFGEGLGLSRIDLSKLPLDLFYQFLRHKDPNLFLKQVNDICMQEDALSDVSNSIELPPLIFLESDFDYFLLPKTLGNFIGEMKLVCESICLDNSDINIDLNNKVVMIEKADPGYDWIFGRNISGLVTKFGGANSHMAIRAAEFGLPAVIGIGEQLYEELKLSQMLEINCSNKILRKIR
jgi:glutamine kinase